MAYHDLITYCADTQALMAEVEHVAPDKIIRDEAGNPIGFSITKTPTVRQGSETLAVVRVDDQELQLIQQLTTLQILAQVPAGGDLLAALRADPQASAIYDRVYPRTPQTVTLEDGTQVTVQPPELIGAIA